MEEFKSPENARLINLLRERGLEDKETRELLNSWALEQEKWAGNSKDYPAAQIEVNLRTARLYFSAGYFDEALDNFEWASTQALNEKRDELYKAIMSEMDRLEDGRSNENTKKRL